MAKREFSDQQANELATLLGAIEQSTGISSAKSTLSYPTRPKETLEAKVFFYHVFLKYFILLFFYYF